MLGSKRSEYKGIQVMSKGKDQHIVRHPDGWAVKAEGAVRATQVFRTQQQAIERGREIAVNQQSEMFIHDREGKIRGRNSYGNDSCPPKG